MATSIVNDLLCHKNLIFSNFSVSSDQLICNSTAEFVLYWICTFKKNISSLNKKKRFKKLKENTNYEKVENNDEDFGNTKSRQKPSHIFKQICLVQFF